MTLEEQIRAFREANPEKYSDNIYNSFYQFWLPKWEQQPTWKLAGRLATWGRNDKRYAKKAIIDKFRRAITQINPMR